MATITLEVVRFRMYAPYPVLLPFYRCILQVVFCGVFSIDCHSASITSTVSKWLPFSFIFNQGNREKYGG
jgi:hypothetical protein